MKSDMDEKLYKILAIYGEQIDPQGWGDGDIDTAVMSIKQVFAYYGLNDALAAASPPKKGL